MTLFIKILTRLYMVYHTVRTSLKSPILSLINLDRRFVALVHDVGASTLALPLALWLRVGSDISLYPTPFILKHMLVYGLLSAGVFLWLRLYRGVWRYVSMYELLAIVVAVTISSLLYIAPMLLMSHTTIMPRSVVIIVWAIAIGVLSTNRLLYRLVRDRLATDQTETPSNTPRARILLIGVSNQADLFIQHVQRYGRARYDILGLIDPTNTRIGRHMHGVEILGQLSDLEAIVAQLNTENRHPHHLVVTDPDFKGDALKPLIALSKELNVDVARVPDMSDLAPSASKKLEIAPISLEDLLGRAEVSLDQKGLHELLHNRRVLVTGAGGTIGGELSRQIASCNPAQLILLDHSEYLLYQINLELSERFPDLQRSAVLCDVSDQGRVDHIFSSHQPEIVFHAAALKHVPIAEENPTEAILTNVIGTRNVADASLKHNASAMILISTDKAVHPSSVMGATKRLCESYCQALDAKKVKSKTRFITTRFGNVLGSTGSVVPLFQRQIDRGGPLTITHPDISRYFMTVKEAVELVLEAAVLGYRSPETKGQIFVLDMGESIKIVDLARQMILLAGLKPDEEIQIQYTGLRPGEKLHEELFYANEEMQTTTSQSLMLASPPILDATQLRQQITNLERHARARQIEGAIAQLKTLVPEYLSPQTVAA